MSVYASNQFKKMGSNDSWVKLMQFIPKGARVLDIGCSSGNLGATLKKEKGAYVVGLDVDKADLAEAKKKLDETFIHNIETDSLERFGKFDVILMADVVEHLVDPVSALKKVKKALKADGRFVFSIPNMANITTRIDLLRGRFEYKDFGLLDRTHIHFYDVHEVNRVLKAAGFEVEKTDCPLREIPEPILKKTLKEIGIDLTPTLVKHLYATDALVYQFVGYAKPTEHPKSFTPKSSSSLDVITRSIDEMKKDYENQLADRDKVIKKTHEELSQILNSRGWKWLEKGHSVKHKLTNTRK